MAQAPPHPSRSRNRLSSIDVIKRRRSCSRLLFGIPDRQEVDEWLNVNAGQHAVEARSKWGFDFERGLPLDAQSSSSPAFEYEPVEERDVSSFVQ